MDVVFAPKEVKKGLKVKDILHILNNIGMIQLEKISF